MWDNMDNTCETDCQCSRLITESFKINSGNNGTKRRREEAINSNFKLKMIPNSIKFTNTINKSPIETPTKRRVFGELQNTQSFSPPLKNLNSPLKTHNSPLNNQNSPLNSRIFNSPLSNRTPTKNLQTPLKSSFFNSFNANSPKNFNSPNKFNLKNSPLSSTSATKLSASFLKRSTSKISKVFEERNKFKMASNLDENRRLDISFDDNEFTMDATFKKGRKFKLDDDKENALDGETFMKIEMVDETTDSAFSENSYSPGRVLQKSNADKKWNLSQISNATTVRNFGSIDPLPSTSGEKTLFAPDTSEIPDCETDFDILHDLDTEFECDRFEQCNKYEIISTDSPNIISKGRESNRKISSKNFNFGAPIGESETSTSFNAKPSANATRMLNFDESFDFTSPLMTKEFLRSKTVSENEMVTENLNVTPKIEAFGSKIDFERKLSTSNLTVKKSLKFSETPTKTQRHMSGSSLGSASNMSLSSMSSTNMSILTSPISTNSSNFKLYPSESTASMESGFISELEEPFLELEETSNSPKMANFTELLSKPIKTSLDDTKEFVLKRPQFSRSVSFNPEIAKVRTSLLSKMSAVSSSPTKKCQKREPIPTEFGSSLSKRRKSGFDTFYLRNTERPSLQRTAERPGLQRALSENSASLMLAMAKSESEQDLIGDFTQPFALPLIDGAHSDLKSISCDTLAKLLTGEYKDIVEEFKVIDCRYPYEFSGGHIDGATNMYSQEQILQLINKPLDCSKRTVLVFHCEFSLERGPKLSRFLRSSDRAKNRDNYPTLHYPEIYLLSGGYSQFQSRHPALCSAGYTAMADPRYRDLMLVYRRGASTSKSFYL